jgi:hypothetical protein
LPSMLLVRSVRLRASLLVLPSKGGEFQFQKGNPILNEEEIHLNIVTFPPSHKIRKRFYVIGLRDRESLDGFYNQLN